MPSPTTLPNTVYGPPDEEPFRLLLSARLMNHSSAPLFGPLASAMASVPVVLGIPASLAIVPCDSIGFSCVVLESDQLDVVKPPPCNTKPGKDWWKIEL